MDLFTLSCDAIPGRPRVLALRGDEELGRCFEYDVCFHLEADDSLDLSPEGLLGEPCTLALGSDGTGGVADAGVTEIAGQIAEVELLEDAPSPVFRLRLVPALWFLRRSAHNRVFVDKAFPDILGEVLEKAGIAASTYALKLRKSYPKREHVCQYQESDLDFIQRWLEREGIYYFFDHKHQGSKLTFCDSAADHEPSSDHPIPYHPTIGADVSATRHLGFFCASQRALPAEVGEADYNYLTPDATIGASEPVAPGLSAKVRRWAPNELDQGGAARVAGLRAELEKSRRRRYLGAGRVLLLHAGFTFEIDRHPTFALNRAYLAVRLRRLGQIGERDGRLISFFQPEETAALAGEALRIEVEAIESDVQFRLPRITPWPRAGLELGMVDGPGSDRYAQIDEHGRYLVKLMMDENASPAGKASTRIRMIQPHGGKQEGWHLPLRKGTEVLVTFIGGDPDRPVIAGAVPNRLTPSPVTRANNTQNVIETGGKSRLEIEDRDGQQYIDVSTPPEETFLHLGAHAGLGDHNVVLSTSGDGLIHTGGNRDITIGGDQNEDVKGKLTEAYHANQSTHVSAAFQETIDAGATQTIHAGLNQTITGGLKQSIQGGEKRTASGGVTETINGGRTQTINGGTTESINGAQSQTITGGAVVMSGGMYTVKADGGFTLKTDGPMNMLANSWLMNAPGGQTNIDNFFFAVANKDTKTYNILFRPNAININIAAIAAAATGARLDRVWRKFEGAGLVLQNNGIQLKSGAKIGTVFGATFVLGFVTFL
ncbi:type VI secretion system Vgr family protein [Sorangium sp. So ce426]|uniref:type VI secretion system Vgr family protein n=1 Tax=Sorangium sp. So ce426 TaxID=3133312 RepID=UPI003F5AE01A